MSDKAMETKVSEVKNDAGNVVERITETWVEKVPMELKHRKVERISYPTIVEEFVETYEDGQAMSSRSDTSKKSDTPKKEMFNGLSDMKNRVMSSGKIVDFVAYIVIVGLLAAIAFNIMK